jgi:hypothetical protein
MVWRLLQPWPLLTPLCSATGTAEEVSARERQEMADFLEAVMDTRPMRYCQALLVAMVRCYITLHAPLLVAMVHCTSW